MLLTIALIVVALLSSALSGMIGMGGGSVLLAAMVILGVEPAVVVPLHAGVQLVSNSTRLWAFRQHLVWPVFLVFALVALPLPMLGLMWLQALPADVVRALMGVVILYAVWVPKWGLAALPLRLAFGMAGALAGALGVIVGATGPLIAPFFLRDDFVKEQIIGTKALCQAYIHGIKIAAFAGVYPVVLADAPDFGDVLGVMLPMALATVAGTYSGKWLLQYVSEQRFVTIYRVVLTLMALKLVATPL